MKDLGGAMKPKVVPFVIFAYITILSSVGQVT